MQLTGSRKASFSFIVILMVTLSLQCSNIYGFTSSKTTYYNPVVTARQQEIEINTRTFATGMIQCNLNEIRSSSLHAEKKKQDANLLEGYEQRGNILFAVVLLTIIWSFSIPPELRREHICFSRNCRIDNTGKFCYDCVSVQEWFSQVSDYYKGGGGVNFDFSIEKKI